MNLHKIEDLFEHEVHAIMAGLMELPAKIANPILRKIDPQFAAQLQANALAAAQLAANESQIPATAPELADAGHDHGLQEAISSSGGPAE